MERNTLKRLKYMPNSVQPISQKQGVFVIVKKLPNGRDSYITFQYQGEDARRITGGYNLAIFNELLFANWYLNKLHDDIQNGTTADFSIKDTLLILQILDQARWDDVHNSVLTDGSTHGAVINPCEGSKDHKCPIFPINLDEYTGFNKLKDALEKYPTTHVQMVNNQK